MQQFNQGLIFFSNRLEVLFDRLKDNLFLSPSTPFSKRLIIVPNRRIEQWIQIQLAQDSRLKIACGFTICSLSRGIEMLWGPPLSHLELILRIEHQLRIILTDSDPIWKPLIHYLQEKERRLIVLAKQLAHLFARYIVYGKEMFDGEPRDWQDVLWQRLSLKNDYPPRPLQNHTVHLFSFNHLPSLYFHLFQKMENPPFFYQLSPCLEFWSDLPSKRASRYLPEQYIEEGHPLLRNLGKVGREMARLIEESDILTQEIYLEPEGKTQLERLQYDLLTLENRTEQLAHDDSIQIHVLGTMHQEITNLFSLLQEGGWEPKNILVLAPDITPYIPYIKSIFGKKLDFQIDSVPIHKQNQQLQGLLLLFDLEKKRWNAPSLLALFNHPLFLKKRRWDSEDLFQMREWIQSTGIRWGVNTRHRNELLKRSHCKKELLDEKTTWQAGFDSLLEELAIPNEQKRIDFTQAELLGDLATLIYTLQDQLAPLHNRMEKSLKKWMDYLKELNETYFAPSEEREKLFHIFNRLITAEKHLPKKKYHFQTVYFLLKESLLHENSTLHANQLQAVRFSSLLPMSLTPAKVICLLGMNHDTFPRKERFVSFDKLKRKGDYCPTQAESDRYLFLEALLSARQKLIICYRGRNPVDLTEEPPSTVVSELLPYVSEKQIIVHPPRSYDPSYFSNNLICHSEADYQMAISALKPKEQLPSFFIRAEKNHPLPEGEKVVEIMDLIRSVRSPLKHYLYHRGAIRFQEEKSIQPEEAFTLSPLQRAILRKASLKMPLSKVLSKAQDFPIGTFGKLAQLQLEREQKELKKFDRWQTIELLVPQQKSELVGEGIWHLPALRISLSSSLTVTLTGKIEGIGSEGLSVLEKGDFKGAVKVWPFFLILNALEDFPPSIGRETLFFALSGHRKTRFFTSATSYLSSLLTYYFWSQQIPSSLFPDWIEAILKEESLKLEKIFLQQPVDRALRWAFRARAHPHLSHLIETYSPWAKQLYKGIADAWF